MAAPKPRSRPPRLVGLLCRLSPRIRDAEEKAMLIAAIGDWCAASGWQMRIRFGRVDVCPPEGVS
jgi:hypothetical protein